MRTAGSGTSSSSHGHWADGEEVVWRQEVPCDCEPPCHAATWQLSHQVSQRQFSVADVLSGLAVEPLSPLVFQPPVAAVG